MSVSRLDRALVIAAAAVQGVPVRTIARGLGMSRSAVYRILDQIQEHVDQADARVTRQRRNFLSGGSQEVMSN